MKLDYKKIVDEVLSKNFWKRIAIMVCSAFLLAFNYNLFLLRNDLVIGGMSGIATIVTNFTSITPALFILLSNIVLLILSFTLLGPKKTGLSIIGSLVYPLMISLTLPLTDYLINYIQINDMLLILVVSSFLYGIANGFIYKTGFTTGGTDILMQIMNKYLKIQTGTASLIINSIIITFGGFVFGIDKALYGIIIVAINSMLVDKIMIGISNSKMFYIRTRKPEEIKEFIKEFNNGFTFIKTDGGSSDNKNNIIMCVVSTRDYYLFKSVLQKIDPQVFYVISDCYEVYGGKRKNKLEFMNN